MSVMVSYKCWFDDFAILHLHCIGTIYRQGNLSFWRRVSLAASLYKSGKAAQLGSSKSLNLSVTIYLHWKWYKGAVNYRVMRFSSFPTWISQRTVSDAGYQKQSWQLRSEKKKMRRSQHLYFVRFSWCLNQCALQKPKMNTSADSDSKQPAITWTV